MKAFTGTVVKQPVVLQKLITSSIQIQDADKPIQIIAFAEKCPIKVKQTLSDAKIGQTISFIGRQKRNPKNNEWEIVVENITSEEDLKYSIDPNVDFNVGGMSSYNNKPITQSEPREGRKQYYTDGDFYWYKDSEIKTPTSF